jgi:hypothetical protein
MKPTLGRIVLYVLTAADAEAINASRGDELTPQRGNRASEGQIFPSMVVAVWGDGENPAINLKVQLDGTDTYWATSRLMSDDKTPGTWHWMEYQKQEAGAKEWKEPNPNVAYQVKADLSTTEEAPAESTAPATTTEQTPEELEKLKEETGF